MGLSGRVKTKKKTVEDFTTLPISPPPRTGSLWRTRAQAIPLELTAVRTSQGPQPESIVRSRSWYKTLQALAVESEHLSQTLLMR